MMKKAVFIIFIIISIILIKKEDNYLIPKEAIRFRIIANSNDIEDQLIKSKVKAELEPKLFKLLNNATSYVEAENTLNNNISEIKKVVASKTDNYQINLGINHFPEKEYKNVKYPEGDYNSLVITLGKGLGNNWWCVLYPPLCFIDESNINDEEYSLFIKDLFSKYLK